MNARPLRAAPALRLAAVVLCAGVLGGCGIGAASPEVSVPGVGPAAEAGACPAEFEQITEAYMLQGLYEVYLKECAGTIRGDPGWGAMVHRELRIAMRGFDAVYEARDHTFFPVKQTDGTCVADFGEGLRTMRKTGTRLDINDGVTSETTFMEVDGPVTVDGSILGWGELPLPPNVRALGPDTVAGVACERYVHTIPLPDGDRGEVRVCVVPLSTNCPAAYAMQPLTFEQDAKLNPRLVNERGRTLMLRMGGVGSTLPQGPLAAPRD